MSQNYAPAMRQQGAVQTVPESTENNIMKMKAQFGLAIGGATPQEQQRRAERFARVCVTAFRKSPQLQRCSQASILGTMMECAQLDLEPNTPAGLAYLIPYGRDCTLQIGYRGLLQLMYRSGAVASFNADVVYRQEVEQGLFSYASGVRPHIEHTINLLDGSARTGNPQDIVAAYACAVLKSGEPVIRLVTRKDIDQARAQGGKNSPAWRDHFAAMAIKTAIKRLASWMPSTRMDEAFAAEERCQPQQASEQVNVGMSLEAMNALMQAQTQDKDVTPSVEAPQEVPAVEQAPEPAPAPAPEPVQAQPAQEKKPESVPVASAPKAERPKAFRPAQEAQTAPKMPEPEAPAPVLDVMNSEDDFVDYLADKNLPEGPARQYVGDMVRDGRAPDVATAKAMFVAQDLGMDLAV